MALNDIAGLIGTDNVLSESYRTPSDTIKYREELERQKEKEASKKKQDRYKQFTERLKFNPDAAQPWKGEENKKLANYIDKLQNMYLSGDIDEAEVQRWQNELSFWADKTDAINKNVLLGVNAATEGNALLNGDFYKNQVYDLVLNEDTTGKDVEGLSTQLPEDLFTKAGASEGYNRNKLAILAEGLFKDHKVKEINPSADGKTYEQLYMDQKPFVDFNGNIDIPQEDIEVLKNDPYIKRYVEDNVDVANGVTEKKVLEELMRPQLGRDSGVSKVGEMPGGEGGDITLHDDYTYGLRVIADMYNQHDNVMKEAEESHLYSEDGEMFWNVTKQLHEYKLTDTQKKRFLFVLKSDPGVIYVADKGKTASGKTSKVNRVKFDDLEKFDLDKGHKLIGGAYIHTGTLSNRSYNKVLAAANKSQNKPYDAEYFGSERPEGFAAKRQALASESISKGEKRKEIKDSKIQELFDEKASKSEFVKNLSEKFKGVHLNINGTVYENPTFKMDSWWGTGVNWWLSDVVIKSDGKEDVTLSLKEFQKKIDDGEFKIISAPTMKAAPKPGKDDTMTDGDKLFINN